VARDQVPCRTMFYNVRVSFVCGQPHRFGNRLEPAEELAAALESYVWRKSFDLLDDSHCTCYRFKNSNLWRIGNWLNGLLGRSDLQRPNAQGFWRNVEPSGNWRRRTASHHACVSFQPATWSVTVSPKN
jgi:hypothetical protein